MAQYGWMIKYNFVVLDINNLDLYIIILENELNDEKVLAERQRVLK